MGYGSSAPAPPATSAPAGDISQCPVMGPNGSSPTAAAAAPAKTAGRDRGVVYNVYAQPIDPTNQMPATANQKPSPGQSTDLSTNRVQSSISKGGTESTWLYPSPQMFWNALVRKNKADGVQEGDMDMVVSIHNEMNERAWKLLLRWEHELHKGEHLDGEPALRRFMGKPYDLSPKAKIKSYLGFGFPFDRHDWYVDRNGVEHRYIIDYYFNANPDASAATTVGPVHPDKGEITPKLTKTIYVDVRPAVDDIGAIMDRLRRFPERAWDAIRRPKFFAEGLDPAKAPKEAAAFALHSSDNLKKDGHGGAAAAAAPVAVAPVAVAPAPSADEGAFRLVDTKCRPKLDALVNAPSDEARSTAHVDFTHCMASLLCPTEASAFIKAVESSAAAGSSGVSGGVEEAAFHAMSKCVAGKMMERRQLK